MESQKGIIIFIFLIIVIAMSGPILPILSMYMQGIEIKPEYIIIALVAIIVIWIVATYNSFVSLAQKVKQAQGGIDVYLKQRFDLIPNLVETVKGYTNHEKDLMENMVKLRQEYLQRNEQDIAESQGLNDRYTNIIALLENYPELKADDMFLELQKSLSKIESQLQAARRIYNSEVTEYNTKLYKMPSNIVAKVFGFKEKALFEIAVSEKTNINVDI